VYERQQINVAGDDKARCNEGGSVPQREAFQAEGDIMSRRTTKAGMGAVSPEQPRASRPPRASTTSAIRGVACPTPADSKRPANPKTSARLPKYSDARSSDEPVGHAATIPAPPLEEGERAPAVSAPILPAASPATGASQPSSDAPRRRSTRRALRVDDVGQAAVALAARSSGSARPRALLRGSISDAPLEPREAFVLALVDGQTSVDTIADATGASVAEVVAVLERLARLKIVAF
jgi:hypothetical protein